MELTLYSVFYQMIDAYSEKEEDYQRLIDMLDNNTEEETRKDSKTMRKLKKDLKTMNKFKEENKTLKEKYATVEEENTTLKEKYAALEKKYADLINRVTSIENGLDISNRGPLNGK